MTKRVYISYTSDLHAYANAVKDGVNSIGLQAVLWKDHAKRASTSVMLGMRQLVQSCDFFIGIYASRYGSIPQLDHEGKPNSQNYSYIHYEYVWAVEQGLKIIPLIMRYEDDYASQREPALLSLLDELMLKHYCAFYAYADQNDYSSVYWTAIELMANSLVPPANSMIVRPNFGLPLKAEQYQCDIFMIMPIYRDELESVYTEEIQSVAQDLNKVIKRGDIFQSLTGQIMAEVWNAICASKVVVVDCTKIDRDGTNGNVYYELGIADSVGKPVILITQTKPDDLPFDIKHRRLIVYDDTGTGRENLRVQLKSALRVIFQELGEPQ